MPVLIYRRRRPAHGADLHARSERADHPRRGRDGSDRLDGARRGVRWRARADERRRVTGCAPLLRDVAALGPAARRDVSLAVRPAEIVGNRQKEAAERRPRAPRARTAAASCSAVSSRAMPAESWSRRRNASSAWCSRISRCDRTSVRGNLAFGLDARGVDHAERERRIDEVLRGVSLADKRDRHRDRLSGGSQQRGRLRARPCWSPRQSAREPLASRRRCGCSRYFATAIAKSTE